MRKCGVETECLAERVVRPGQYRCQDILDLEKATKQDIWMGEKESVERISGSQLEMFVQMLAAGGCHCVYGFIWDLRLCRLVFFHLTSFQLLELGLHFFDLRSIHCQSKKDLLFI